MKCLKTCLIAAMATSSFSPAAFAKAPPPVAASVFAVDVLTVCKMELDATLSGEKDFLIRYGVSTKMPIEDFKALVSICSVYKRGVRDFITIVNAKGGPSA